MPSKMRDAHKQNLQRAVGNVEWCLDKISQLGVQFTEDNKYYDETNTPLPELNKALLYGLMLATDACDDLIAILKKLEELI